MKMNKHYNELKASYLFVDIAHKVAAYQEAHPEKEIIRLGPSRWPSAWSRPCMTLPMRWVPRKASTAMARSRATPS